MGNSDFTYEKLMDVKKEMLETKPDLKAELKRTKKNSEDLQRMSIEEIEIAFNIIYAYNYGYFVQ